MASGPQPYQQRIIIEADAGEITVTGVGEQIGLRARIDGEIDEDGIICVPAKNLRAFADGFGKEEIEVTLRATENDLELKADEGRTRYRIPLEDMDDAVRPDFPKKVDFFDVKVEDLLYLADHTTFAADVVDGGNFDMTSILLELTGGVWKAVATDGRRLALASSPKRKKRKGKHSFLIPARVLTAIHRIAKDEGEDAIVQLGIDESKQHGLFVMESAKILGLLSAGEFPNYRDVIPEMCDRSIEFNREELLAAVTRTTCLCAGDDVLRLRFEDDQLDMLCNGTTDSWQAHGTHPIGTPGPNVTVGVNHRFLLDGLRAADSEVISIDLTDRKSAMVIRGEKNFRYIVMPMEIPEEAA